MPSDQITYTFRLPKDLKDAMRADAEKHARSVNQHVVDILGSYLRGDLIPAEKLLTEPAVRKLIAAAVELSKLQGKKSERGKG